MSKIKTAMYGITHEHAAGKMQTLLRMSDTFEFVGCVDDTATSKVRFNAACDVVSVFDGQPRLTAAARSTPSTPTCTTITATRRTAPISRISKAGSCTTSAAI